MSRSALSFVSVLFLLATFPFFVSAQTGTLCNQYQGGSTPPAGYGAAWNVLSTAKEMLVTSICDFSEETSITTVGSGGSNQYVYKIRHYYSSSKQQWVSTPLQGIFVEGSQEWLLGTGTIQAGITPLKQLYWVGYVCQWTGTAWKCGCRDAACTTNYWQLQAMVNPNGEEPGATTGGTTGGTIGGTTGSTTGSEPVGGGSTIPAATRTVQVANNSQLSSALSASLPGDRIVLANGSYTGFTVTKSGQNGKPIVIVAANIHGPKVSSDIQISGDYVWVFGMDMGSRGITFSGNYDRISRNYFKASVRAGIFADKPSRNGEIDHNEHAGGTLKDTGSSGASPIFARYQCPEPARHYIHHNYIHDVSGGGNVSEAIMSGFGLGCSQSTHDPGSAGALIEYNLITNYSAGYCLRTKSDDNIFRFNTCINTNSVQNRSGENNQWIANWIENAGNMMMFDRNHMVMGNQLIGTRLWIAAGTLRGDDTESGYIAADDLIVAGNNGPLVIGEYWKGDTAGTLPVKNTRVEAHVTGNGCGQGSVTCKNQTGTTFSATTNRTIPQAFKLTPSQVGPNAPTAPKF